MLAAAGRAIITVVMIYSTCLQGGAVLAINTAAMHGGKSFGQQASIMGARLCFTGLSTMLLDKKASIPLNALFHLVSIVFQNKLLPNHSLGISEDGHDFNDEGGKLESLLRFAQ